MMCTISPAPMSTTSSCGAASCRFSTLVCCDLRRHVRVRAHGHLVGVRRIELYFNTAVGARTVPGPDSVQVGDPRGVRDLHDPAKRQLSLTYRHGFLSPAKESENLARLVDACQQR